MNSVVQEVKITNSTVSGSHVDPSKHSRNKKLRSFNEKIDVRPLMPKTMPFDRSAFPYPNFMRKGTIPRGFRPTLFGTSVSEIKCFFDSTEKPRTE